MGKRGKKLQVEAREKRRMRVTPIQRSGKTETESRPQATREADVVLVMLLTVYRASGWC